MGAENDHVGRNRATWSAWAAEYVEPAHRAWSGEPRWGVWGVPESEVGALPDVHGLEVVELGCGTGYLSSWLLRLGARRAVGLDLTATQLATAASLQREFKRPFPLVMGTRNNRRFATAASM